MPAAASAGPRPRALTLQTLLHLGLLEYSDELRTQLLAPSAGETLRSGDPREVEVRAASIWAVELLRRAWPSPKEQPSPSPSEVAPDGSTDPAAFPPLAILIDFYLWDYAAARRGELVDCPIHRTRTYFY